MKNRYHRALGDLLDVDLDIDLAVDIHWDTIIKALEICQGVSEMGLIDEDTSANDNEG